MRIEIMPFHKPVMGAYPIKTQELIPQAGFIKCQHCQNGVAKQVVDGKDLVWNCIFCGWSKPEREPEHIRYGEEGVHYGKRY